MSGFLDYLNKKEAQKNQPVTKVVAESIVKTKPVNIPTKLCQHCNQTISETAKFCQFCGKELVAEQIIPQNMTKAEWAAKHASEILEGMGSEMKPGPSQYETPKSKEVTDYANQLL